MRLPPPQAWSHTDYGKFLRGTDSVILRRSRRIWPPDETFLPFVTQILHCAALRSEPALSVAEGMTHGTQESFIIRLIFPLLSPTTPATNSHECVHYHFALLRISPPVPSAARLRSPEARLRTLHVRTGRKYTRPAAVVNGKKDIFVAFFHNMSGSLRPVGREEWKFRRIFLYCRLVGCTLCRNWPQRADGIGICSLVLR